jgi:gluconate 2-dehydrogenase gamma chain
MTRQSRPISRREAIKKAGVVVAATGAITVATGYAPEVAQPADRPADILNDPTPPDLKYPAVPPAPAQPPEHGQLRVLSVHEARTVEALTARIMPGSPEDPGAREAGVVVYIDYLLSINEGFSEPTYRQPPFAQVYTGAEPPSDAESYDVVWVPADLIARYGFQSPLTPREVYRIGLESVDRYASARFRRDFIDLDEGDQDSIISDMVAGRATGFRQVSAGQFFLVLRRHTAEGMFGDPAYGGNRGLVGWWLIGFPGAQRAWSIEELRTDGPHRTPQSHDQLPPTKPEDNMFGGAILPLSGTDPRTWNNAHQHPQPTVKPK